MDEKEVTLTAGNTPDIDNEIASMRLEIISILKNDPRNCRALRRALTCYARLLCQQRLPDNINREAIIVAEIIQQFIDYVIPARPEHSRKIYPEQRRGSCFVPVRGKTTQLEITFSEAGRSPLFTI
jgi:hypothetical protein